VCCHALLTVCDYEEKKNESINHYRDTYILEKKNDREYLMMSNTRNPLFFLVHVLSIFSMLCLSRMLT